MKIRIERIHPEAQLPHYAHGPSEDAGMDLRAIEEVRLEPGVPGLIPTGLRVEIPSGCEGQIRMRSGLALKHALILPNSPGTIDPGYRGEVKVIVLNLGREAYTVRKGERIAQLVVARYEPVEWEEAGVNDSARGEGGFGSTGAH
ncbi:MAG: dUTP diphosphatase [Acidobacteria bacterium]|nr:dUTP diphosphatase [Acidobacteriota bacterium]